MEKNKEIGTDGSFKRQKSLFSTSFGDGPEELPVVKDRYRLIWAAPCPWSHRAVIVRQLLGLEDVISLGEVDPIRPVLSRVDWAFTLNENEVDPVLNIKYLSEIYTKTDPDYSGRPTVPAVVDLKTEKIVINDYFTLTTQFETSWKPYHKKDAPDLYPEHLRIEIDALNETIYRDINNGVYKCGFARSQAAYDVAYDVLFARLEELEQHLSKQRFLHGDFIMESDVRLYVTLVRFDVSYYSVFKTNKKRIIDFPNLWGYARDLYATPGFGSTTNFDAIKKHYLISARLSDVGKEEDTIIPKGPDLSGWDIDPERQHLSGSKDKFLISK